MNNSKSCIEKSKQLLAELGNVQARTQFGGYSLSVEKVVFALVSKGELYLRASEQMQAYQLNNTLQPFVFYKRGASVVLNYFLVDHQLWRSTQTLVELSRSALLSARKVTLNKQCLKRIKDLPNLGIRMETLLREIGIDNVEKLVLVGAKQCWARLHINNKHLGLATLYALQGAILGQHLAVLPNNIKEELRLWYLEYLKQRSNHLPVATIIPVTSS